MHELRVALDRKLDTESFREWQREQLQFNRLFEHNLTLKTDKTEVKKAIAYIESKIRELAAVVTDQEVSQLEAFALKRPKCLSCEKQLKEVYPKESREMDSNFNTLYNTQSFKFKKVGRAGLNKRSLI
jgi:hypothetical protein